MHILIGLITLVGVPTVWCSRSQMAREAWEDLHAAERRPMSRRKTHPRDDLTAGA